MFTMFTLRSTGEHALTAHVGGIDKKKRCHRILSISVLDALNPFCLLSAYSHHSHI